MFGIGGFNPISLLATAALGPMGGIVAQLASQVMSQIGQQFIQNLGQNMGLPQSSIDFAQAGLAANYGDFRGSAQNLDEALSAFQQGANLSPSEAGEADRAIQDMLRDAVMNQSDREEVREAKAGGRSGGGWLRAMAEALGKKLDAAAHEMQDLANKIDKEDPSTTTDFQVASQEFNMLMNAANTAIKSIGEAMANTARKQ